MTGDWKKTAAQHRKLYKELLRKARLRRGMERHLPALHEAAFEKIDCLQCAGCCKTISPRFKTPDITRIARFLKLRESALIEQYLRLDEDGDYVVQQSPCPFLGADNYCGIYDVRPGDCRKYPYTDSGEFFEYTNTTLLNSTICPAVFEVLEKLRQVPL
ncbi:MAG: YkgJ family cysteine cluster protein [Chitinophagales bacterium]